MTESLDAPYGVVAEVRAAQPFPWWAFLFTGLLAVALGVAVLVWPDISLRVMAAMVGIWLFLAGLARILLAFLPSSGSVASHVLSGIVGIVVLIGGLLCLRDLVTRLAVLALIFSTTWILTGLAGVLAGLQATGSRRAALLVAGLLTMVLGGILLFVPSLSLGSLVLLTGLGSLIAGLAEVVLAFVLRRPAGGQHPG
ncbi:HdeD family acid-resistance protein [Paractinoplanes brasiliensis]|uniref:Uncharacterized membrane protein HdeD (DUF308 family) n=1 Tax=Paractinoplanes brasiliensis TaxID=52695 RepID=A0A4R6J7F7_9ACTN|nr:DUF308 domain-containing protein [Actinoplanes brasiliensis]TDO31473.1 uncharacterized membrane protein HdeD (DUF308 family) [Actinoplanes brasiliensis]